MFKVLMILFPIMAIIVFLIAFIFIIFIGLKSYSEWNKNNHSPILTIWSKVVAKRSYNAHHDHSHYQIYYVTFEFENNERLELSVPVNEFGYLVEGDIGILSFQGTRYIKYERENVI